MCAVGQQYWKLEQFATIGHGQGWADQHHAAFGVRKAKRENFRHEGANLARRKIHHGCDLAAEQCFRRIVLGDLRR